MSLPSFPKRDNAPTRDEVINQIISSIAMEELGLSHIINAEGEKLQYALGTIPDNPCLDGQLTLDDLLELNKSVHKTLDSTMLNQLFLKDKLQSALNASTMKGAPGIGTTIKGTAESKEQLDTEHSDGPPEDAYLVKGELYIWNKEEGWHSVGSLMGPQGPQGPATIDVNNEVEELDPGEEPYVINEGDTKDAKLKFGIPRGKDGKSAYEVALGKGFIGTEDDWLATLEGKSAYEVALKNGFVGSEAEWLSSLKASAVTVIPFASQQAPYVGTNASGEPVNVALLGFGYLGFNTGGGENAQVAIPIDASDASFNLGAAGNENRQLAFSLPFKMKLNSIYLTTGNWERFVLIPAGTTVFPYVQIYTAPAGTNTFMPLEGAVVKPTDGLHPESAQPSTMLKAETKGLDIEIEAGTRIAICAMMEIHGDSDRRNYYLYFTGGIGLSLA